MMSGLGIDKRRFPRADFPCKIVVLRDDEKQTFSTHTQNIGEGGVCVVIPEQLPSSCAVVIMLYLRDGHIPINCQGRIVWSIKQEDKFNTGIKFVDIKKPDSLRIKRIVQECLNR